MTGPRAPDGSLDPHAPWHLLHEGYTVLVSEADGTIDASAAGHERVGLFDFDTRVLSRHRLTVDGETPRCLSAGSIDARHWESRLVVPRAGGDAAGPALPQDTTEILLVRRVGPGLEQRITVRNHAMTPVAHVLAIEIDADFADVMALDAPPRPSARITRRYDASAHSVTFDYRDREGDREVARGLCVRVTGDAPAVHVRHHATLTFRLTLGPRATWTATLGFASFVDGVWREPLREDGDGRTERDQQRTAWHAERTHLASSNTLVAAAFERAAEDLVALRAWEHDVAPDAWMPNAGVPTYTGVFGRDVLTAAWQSATVSTEPMRGALEILARTQAREDDAWRDAEPGKLVHEMRRGPRADLGLLPHSAYYGEQTAPSMFVVVLSEYWHWTGDTEALRRHLPVAERIFDWASRYGDPDGDGLLEYERRSPRGLKNHGWKDSDEAIRYPDGTLVPNPIATLEEQAFHFIALERMAEILLALDDEDGAERYLERARLLRERVNAAYWLPDESFYAMALDPDKRPVGSVGSNVGHALAAGLVPAARARAVADRLVSSELFGRCGVRTLSSAHPSYNPFAYHLGTVWPVENATFAFGLKRYGLDDHAERVVTALFATASHFAWSRLPEALGGDSVDGAALSSVYPGSNAPQAWSASAVAMAVQALLGVYAFAPAHILALVRPRLPAWIDWVELRRLRVGDAVVSLRFVRGDDGSAHVDVVEQSGRLVVTTVPPPVDLEPEHEGTLDRVKEWAVAHAPGRLGRALRIAVGIEHELE